MKLKRNFFAALACVAALPSLHAETIRYWSGATNGDFALDSNWSTGVAPIATQSGFIENGTTAVINGTYAPSLLDIRLGQTAATAVTGNGLIQNTGTVTLTGNLVTGVAPNVANTVTLNNDAILNVAKITRIGNNGAGATSQFTMNGGTLTSGTEFSVGYKAGTGRADMLGGTLTSSGTFLIGYDVGGNGQFNQSGGTVNVASSMKIASVTAASGTTTTTGSVKLSGDAVFNLLNSVAATGFSIGGGDYGNGTLEMSGNAVLNVPAASAIAFAAGVNSQAHVSLSGNSQLNLSPALTVLSTSNGTSNQTDINLSGTSQFNLTGGRLVLGIAGVGSVSTLNISDSAVLSVKDIRVGGNTGTPSVNGVINLNGGTIIADSIQKGTSTLASNATQIALNLNGGTLKMRSGAITADFLKTVYLTFLSGGLKFDTNSFSTTLTNNLRGPGGLTKLGDGTLTINTTTTSYQGDTVVSQGTLDLKGAILSDTASVSIAGSGILNLGHTSQDSIASLTLDGVVQAGGKTYGADGSTADVTTPLITGTGLLRVSVASTGRNLTWNGASGASWDSVSPNFLDGNNNPTTFTAGDHVTFNYSGSTPLEVVLTGTLEADGVTFTGTGPVNLSGTAGGLIGTRGIVKNGSGTVTLGGPLSTFTGPVQVNAGILKMGDNKAFGASSGITIADGAQIDINGKAPGSIYNYTIGGLGPAGGSQITNTGPGLFGLAGIKNLTLTADATIGGDGRFDVAEGGTITGNGHTLTKIGTADMAFRGNASASPIRFVITAGRCWAEANDNAFGGATGAVVANAGALVGTNGARTIATPLSLLGGSTLVNIGSGKQTWTGAISISGDVTIQSDSGYTTELNGALTGTGNITKTAEGAVIFLLPNYTGNTNVAAGTLVFSTPTLADTGNVTIAANAYLNLVTAAEDSIASLTLGSLVAPANSVWGASYNTTVANPTTLLQGDGTLRALGTPSTATGYAGWAQQNGLSGASAAASFDADFDGIPNGIEFVTGSNPQQSDLSKLPTSTIANGYLVFTFRRVAAAVPYSPHVQYGSTLAGWTDAADGSNGILVTTATAETNVDLVTVKIPLTLATGSKLFARLAVSLPNP